MANQKHLDLLKSDTKAWNEWRMKPRHIQIDLSEADLSGAQLSGANLIAVDLSRANLSGADLSNSYLDGADLIGADLSYADLSQSSLWKADLSGVNLTGACLQETNLRFANLSVADLKDANLIGTNLSGTNLSRANLTGCLIHAISAWKVHLEDTTQANLVITDEGEPSITVDSLEVAQFIYLLLNNQKIRDVIDTITSKVVLILGRFILERKAVLDALRDELRKRNYLPVLFDFEKPVSRDRTETVSTLAHLARFIIFDLTDPSSAPHEVATIIPQCIVPIQPLLLQDDTQPRQEYAMFQDLRARYHWVLPTYHYLDTASLLESLKEHVIAPAEQKAEELAMR